MTRNLIRWVISRDERAGRAFHGYEDFYGQPDIGGVVRRLNPARVAFLRIRGSSFQISKKIRPMRKYPLPKGALVCIGKQDETA